eukprot:TRINITY_DN328_c0_g3_i2.p1 TRINITY_DN328_c0_g3~~TRINITY_DN328_c0_g3_i2.p1  ORF type:complete len:239 (+),score=76.45 TRINITY_DN328_c0_g3_i2:48-719(+)
MCIRDRDIMIKEHDHLFKLVIIGNSGVGKSSLLLRFADDQFSDSYLTTIGVDFRFKTLDIDGKSVKLQIWDTAGQERFRTITNAYYKGADGIIIVYDCTSQDSFDDIENYWINEVAQYGEKNVELMLIGNKSDLLEDKKVQKATAEEYAKQKKMQFFEASAKTADSVIESFKTLSRILISKNQSTQQSTTNSTQQSESVTKQSQPTQLQRNKQIKPVKKGNCC